MKREKYRLWKYILEGNNHGEIRLLFLSLVVDWRWKQFFHSQVFRAILVLSKAKHGKLQFSGWKSSQQKILFMETVLQPMTAMAFLTPVHVPTHTSLLKVPFTVNALGASPA